MINWSVDMQILFITTIIFCTIFFIRTRRNIDFFLFAYVSSVVYFFPGLFGYVLSPSISGYRVENSIPNGAYIIYISVLSLLTMSAFIYDKWSRNKVFSTKILKGEVNAEKILYLIAIFIGILFVFTEWGEIIGAGKPNFGRIHPIYQIFVGLALTYSIGMKRKKMSFILLGLLLIDIYGGNREGLAIALMAGVIFYMEQYRDISLLKYKKTILLGLFAFFFFSIYKEVYSAIKIQNWDLVYLRLGDPQFWLDSISRIESFTTQDILARTIEFNIKFPLGEWIKPIFHNLIIFAPSFGATSISYSSAFTQQVYSFVNYGLASNIWAEGYAVGGYSMVGILVFFYSTFLPVLTNVLLRKTKGIMHVALIFSASYFFFFIHRTGLNYMLTIQKRIVFALIFVSIATILLSNIKTTSKNDGKKI